MTWTEAHCPKVQGLTRQLAILPIWIVELRNFLFNNASSKTFPNWLVKNQKWENNLTYLNIDSQKIRKQDRTLALKSESRWFLVPNRPTLWPERAMQTGQKGLRQNSKVQRPSKDHIRALVAENITPSLFIVDISFFYFLFDFSAHSIIS